MFLTTIQNSFTNAVKTVIAFIPQIIAAIVIIIIGLIVSGIFRSLLRKFFKKINFDGLLEKTGILSTMESGGVKIDPAEIIAWLVYWFILLIFIIAAVNSLQLPALTSVLNQIYAYIPQVISALLIFFIGIFIAQFIGNIVEDMGTLKQMGLSGIISLSVRWLAILFTFLAALQELAIAPQLINILFGGIIVSTFAGVGLAIGLAFGLGGRDTAAKVTESMYTSASTASRQNLKQNPRR